MQFFNRAAKFVKKRKYLEKLNLALAAALILGSTGSLSFAQDSSLRGTLQSDGVCESNNNSGDPDCFVTGSEGVTG